MAFLRSANNSWFNAAIVLFVVCFVIFMPLLDRSICRRLGLNIEHGISRNPRSESLLLLRKLVLLAIFALYICANLYLVFFSRVATTEYQVYINPLGDLIAAVNFDGDLSNLISDIRSSGFINGLREYITIVRYSDLAQAMMNILFYVPMGYLLPYVFDWFRKNIRRSLFVCFLCSFLTENLQLVFKRGYYDFDDMIFNTLGGLLGVLLYQYFAFVLTYPRWTKELKRYYRFRRTARHTALFPFSKRIDCGRVTLLASYEDDIYAFYVETLGFQLRGQRVPLDDDTTSMLLVLGGAAVEFLCSNSNEPIPPQTVQITVHNLDRVRRKLEKEGIEVGGYKPDLYTNRRCMTLTGPDGVHIVISE